MTDRNLADWIAVDWGTTNLRVWAMTTGGSVLASRKSGKGMQSLRPEDFEGVLLGLVSDWLAEHRVTPVMCCGMVGARQGWVEAPYQTVPCNPASSSMTVQVPSNDPRINVHIISGIKQIDPADVMRGEETQIAGFLTMRPDFDGVVCLPGTHTKWVRIEAEEILFFSTFMSGELFSLLADNSVLRHSIATEGWDENTFIEALSETISKPETLASKLFGLRAASLVSSLDPKVAKARLSGMIIGLELGASRPYWFGQNVAILGDNSLANIYAHALKAQGLNPELIDVEELTLTGLRNAHLKINEPEIER